MACSVEPGPQRGGLGAQLMAGLEGQRVGQRLEHAGCRVEPAGTGGLLAALSMWRRLLVLGPKKFGDVTYLGTFPIRDLQQPYDVLFARHAGVNEWADQNRIVVLYPQAMPTNAVSGNALSCTYASGIMYSGRSSGSLTRICDRSRL